MAVNFRPPEPLGPQHDLTQFANGRHASLDEWLRLRARASDGLSARTYVSCSSEDRERVVGYYAIATSKVHRGDMPSARLRKGMPEDVPMLLIGRLAVDQSFQRMRLGADLLAHALERCRAAGEIAGARGVLAHAINDEALSFYRYHGFIDAEGHGDRAVVMPMEMLRTVI